MAKTQALQRRTSSEVLGAEVEVVSIDAIQAITKAEVDVQIATARAYPRDIRQFLEEAKMMATIDGQTASECIYALERKEANGSKKIIKGPSIRLAEIAVSCYGNMRLGSRAVGEDGTSVIGQGIAHDLQKNNAVTREVKRRITTREGRRFSDDMVIVTGNAAAAIALRNAVYTIIPRAYINQLQAFVEQHIADEQGIGKKLLENAKKAVAWFVDRGATQEQVFQKLGRRSMEEVSGPDIVILRGFVTAIDKEHSLSMGELFPAQATLSTSRLATPVTEVEDGEASENEDEEEAPFL